MDLTIIIPIGGKQLRKNLIVGAGPYTDKNGITLGGDLVYQLKSIRLDLAIIGRANIVNLESTGTTGWITLGANLGLQF